MNLTTVARQNWREWDLRDWNHKLFEHFFRISESDTSPVSRIVVTSEELCKLTDDAQATPSDALEAFRTCVLSKLKASQSSLCRDAEELEWSSERSGESGQSIPPYFAHLVVTCIAASGTGAKNPKTEFRKRLNEFLGRGRHKSSYPLGRLPKLWEMLRGWLDKAVASGEPYRQLVLYRAPHLKLIGYTMSLAFPALKDLEKLVNVLADLPLPPPVAQVFERIENSSSGFSSSFQQSYYAFRRDYDGRRKDLYARPFWSAIIDAIHRAPFTLRKTYATNTKYGLRLDQDLSWMYVLALLVDRSIAPTSQVYSEPYDECGASDFKYRVEVTEGVSTSIGSIVFNSSVAEDCPGLTKSDLMLAVSTGLLLFIQNEEGIWHLSFSKPSTGRVRALIRSDIAESFATSLSYAGGALSLRESHYPGWTEVSEFDANHLSLADFRGTPFLGIRCLAEVILSPRILLCNGVRLRNTWLGRRLALPQVFIEPFETGVNIQPALATPGDHWVLALEKSLIAADANTIPSSPPLSADLEGEFIFQAREGERVAAARRVAFQKNVQEVCYLPCRDPARWFIEGTSEPSEKVTLTFPPVPTNGLEHGTETGLQGVERNGVPVFDLEEAEDVEALVDVLAAISLRRTGITEGDLCSWFTRALGVEKRLLWDCIRAWVECGCFDQYIYRHWRKRTYFARPPQFITYRLRNGNVGATVSGLLPSGWLRRLEDEAERMDVAVHKYGSRNRFVPSPVCLSTDSMDSLSELAVRLAVNPPRCLARLDDIISPIVTITQKTQDLPRGYKLERVIWNGKAKVEWYRRDEGPDFFVVRLGETIKFGTWLRNWALLAAAEFESVNAFENVSEKTLVRAAFFEGYLPVAIGRWNTCASGIAQGPVVTQSGKMQYVYHFPDRRALGVAMKLFGSAAFPAELVGRGRWLAQLTSTELLPSTGMRIPIASDIRLALERCKQVPGCERLAELQTIQPQLFPHLKAFSSALAGKDGN